MSQSQLRETGWRLVLAELITWEMVNIYTNNAKCPPTPKQKQQTTDGSVKIYQIILAYGNIIQTRFEKLLKYFFLDTSSVMSASPFNNVIIKTSSNKHRLCVLDLSSGDTLYQIPIDMFVDQILISEGWVVLVNANNLLLSVILDFNWLNQATTISEINLKDV